MKYYKTDKNEIYAYEDDTNKYFLASMIDKLGLTPITKDQILEVKTQYDIDNNISEKEEYRTLNDYLAYTDWIVIKCYELGLSVSDTYPDEYEKRQAARARINEIELLLNSKTDGNSN